MIFGAGVQIRNGNYVTLNKIVKGIQSAPLVVCVESSGYGYLYANIVEGDDCIHNDQDDFVLFVEASKLISTLNYGLRSDKTYATQSGHIHVDIRDLYLDNNAAVGIEMGNVGGHGKIVGFIDHIVSINDRSSTCIRIPTSGIGTQSVVSLIISEIKTSGVAYQCPSGPDSNNLHLVCPVITGTRIGDPKTILTEDTFPHGSVDGGIALFDGVSGKILRDSGLTFSTIGSNIIGLQNPSTQSYITISPSGVISLIS